MLVNIICIDTFYHLQPGVLIHAFILFASVIYLFLQSYKQLVDFFFKTVHLVTLPDNTKIAKTGLQAGLVLLPLLPIATYNFPDKHPRFTGKYEVSHLKVNGMSVSANSARDSVLTVMYLDWQDDLALIFNHYNSRYIGTYSFDENTDSISAHWRYPAGFDTPFKGKFISSGKPGSYHFSGILGTDSIDMQLEKVAEPKR